MRWFQIGIRDLFATITLLSILAGWFYDHSRMSAELLKRDKELVTVKNEGVFAKFSLKQCEVARDIERDPRRYREQIWSLRPASIREWQVVDPRVTIPTITAVSSTTIRRQQESSLVIRGTFLFGDIVLRRESLELRPEVVIARITDADKQIANLSALTVIFNVDVPVGDGYELVIRSFKGESNVIGGFSVTQ